MNAIKIVEFIKAVEQVCHHLKPAIVTLVLTAVAAVELWQWFARIAFHAAGAGGGE